MLTSTVYWITLSIRMSLLCGEGTLIFLRQSNGREIRHSLVIVTHPAAHVCTDSAEMVAWPQCARAARHTEFEFKYLTYWDLCAVLS